MRLKEQPPLLGFQRTPEREAERGAQESSGQRAHVHFDLRADKTLRSKSRDCGESGDLCSKSTSVLRAEKLIYWIFNGLSGACTQACPFHSASKRHKLKV